jgi:hypothetical protein
MRWVPVAPLTMPSRQLNPPFNQFTSHKEHHMYDEPRHLKDREIKSRYDDETYEALKAVARLHKLQLAVFVRMCVEEKLESIVERDVTANHQMG